MISYVENNELDYYGASFGDYCFIHTIKYELNILHWIEIREHTFVFAWKILLILLKIRIDKEDSSCMRREPLKPSQQLRKPFPLDLKVFSVWPAWLEKLLRPTPI